MAKDWRTLKLEVLAETTQFVKGMDKANATTKSFGDKIGDFAKKAGIALAAVGAAAGAMAIKIGKDAIAAASDLAETTSKVNVIFGDTAKTIEAFGAQAAASLGQTRTQAMNAAATFGIFGKSAGLAGEELGQFSTEFVQLASDLASFNNTSVDQAITALGAALRGESEPIRAYGVLLNDATLKAKALELGIYSGTGTLSAQQKVLAAHKVILEQTRDAQGDFARTADGMANSQRILTARLEEAKIVLGNALLPIALQVVNLFNDKFLPVIERLASSFGGGNGIIAQVQSFVSTARNALVPVIEALQSSFNKVSEAVSTNRGNLQSFLTLIQTLYSFFVTYFVPILKNQVVAAIQGIGTAFSLVLKVVSPIIGNISKLITGIINVVDKAIAGIINLANKAIDAINAVLRAYNAIPGLADIGLISRIGARAATDSNEVDVSRRPGSQQTAQQAFMTEKGLTAGEFNAFASWAESQGLFPDRTGATVAQLTAAFSKYKKSTAPSTTIPGLSTVTDGAAGTSSAAGTVAKAVETAANAAKKIVEEIVDLRPSLISVADVVARERGDIINYGVSAPGAFNVAAARMGEAGITINVSAPSAIDEEGFKRAVVDALNESANRGTGGAGGLREIAQVL